MKQAKVELGDSVFLKELDIFSNEDRRFLYELLKEREPDENISHVSLPSFDQHIAFLKSKPYLKWWIIEREGEMVGSLYLTKKEGICKNAIGIHLKRGFFRNGIGALAISYLISEYKSLSLTANISPRNERSISFFLKQGFTHVQNTYEYRDKK